MKKPTIKKPKAFKLDVFEVIGMVDKNYREYYHDIPEEEQKALKASLFTLIRWISGVEGKSEDLQAHYVMTVNEYFNKHFFTLSNHPELLWRLLCLCSYNDKVHRRTWFKGKIAAKNKKEAFLMELYPNHKPDEISLMSKVMSDEDIIQLAMDLGYEDKEVMKIL